MDELINNRRLINGLLFSFILAFALFMHFPYLNVFPTHVHAWAQTDRLSLVQGFIDNGFNFFLPQTFVMNHQFPNHWFSDDGSPITSVDFPIHEYLIAIFVKLSGTSIVLAFRTYTILFSSLGLFYIYKLNRFLGNDFFIAVFMVLFTSTSPLYTYYQGGMLPSIPCLSLSIIGLYHFIKYRKDKSNKSFIFSMIFLTIAALSRLSFAIPLIAIFSFEMLKYSKISKLNKQKLFLSLSAFILILGYWIYNWYLRYTYGSIFLGNPLPPNGVKHFIGILLRSFNKWNEVYFSQIHYAVILILVLLVGFIKLKKYKTTHISLKLKPFLTIYFIGVLIFSVLIMRQFPAHDYYFLDTLFLPIILVICFLFQQLPRLSKIWHRLIYVMVLVSIAYPLYMHASAFQKTRMTVSCQNDMHNTYNNFKHGDLFLDEAGISKDSKLLLLYTGAPNFPFINLKRKGYALMYEKKEQIMNALSWDYNYLILETDFYLNNSYLSYPNMLDNMTQIANNGRLMICKRTDVKSIKDPFSFIGMDKWNSCFHFEGDFSDTIGTKWRNTTITQDPESSNKWAIISTKLEYGLGFKSADILRSGMKNFNVLLNGKFQKKFNTDIVIIASIKENGKEIYCKSMNLNKLILNTQTWTELHLLFNLPKQNFEKAALEFFIFNPGRNELYIDDIELKAF